MIKIVILLFCFIVSVAFAKAPEDMAGAWKSLKGIHPNLAKQADALEAFVKLPPASVCVLTNRKVKNRLLEFQ
jgi:hypothetical protein